MAGLRSHRCTYIARAALRLRSGMRKQSRYETVQFRLTSVGDRPVIHSPDAPVGDVITLLFVDARRRCAGIVTWPHVKIHWVQLVAIHHHRNGAAVQIVEPATDQRISLLREVDYWRRKIEFPVEP